MLALEIGVGLEVACRLESGWRADVQRSALMIAMTFAEAPASQLEAQPFFRESNLLNICRGGSLHVLENALDKILREMRLYLCSILPRELYCRVFPVQQLSRLLESSTKSSAIRYVPTHPIDKKTGEICMEFSWRFRRFFCQPAATVPYRTVPR